MEYNYSENQELWLLNIIWVNCSTTISIYLSGSKQALWFSMNTKTKVKWKIMADGSADTSDVSIGNGFVEVFCTAWNFSLVWFDDNLSKKSIPNDSTATAIYLPIDTPIE